MSEHTQRTTTILTYAGILPFLFLGIAVVMKFSGQDYGFALRGYSVVIASFLCGIHWAVHLFFPDRCRRNFLVMSNVITLIAYASLLIGQQNIVFLLESLCFVVLLWIDYKVLILGIIPRWYFELRRNATAVVVFVLIGAAFLP